MKSYLVTVWQGGKQWSYMLHSSDVAQYTEQLKKQDYNRFTVEEMTL